MKSINVVSPVYKNMAVNFDGFIANFNIEGKATIQCEDKELEKLEAIFTKHPNIYKEGTKPSAENKESTQESKKEEPSNTEEFNFMKAKNIELAKENALLKKENEELKQKVQYYADLYEKNNDESEKENAEETKEKENEGALKEEEKEVKEEKNDNINIEEELNKKTVAQLKQILNEDFGAFKEDWKSLTKKEDIIKYIVSKVS